VLWECSGSALGVLWECSGSGLGVLWECSGSALGVLWECSGNALGMLWECSGTALGLLWEHPSGIPGALPGTAQSTPMRPSLINSPQLNTGKKSLGVFPWELFLGESGSAPHRKSSIIYMRKHQI